MDVGQLGSQFGSDVLGEFTVSGSTDQLHNDGGAIVDTANPIGNLSNLGSMESGNPSPATARKSDLVWPGAVMIGLLVGYFYLVVDGFGPDQIMSPLKWLQRSWNPETRFEHGPLVPLISIALLFWQGKTLKAAAAEGKAANRAAILGFLTAVLGAFLFLAAHRSGQVRLAIGGLPMILWGSAWFLWGWPVARLTAFPFFLLWLAIPVPQFMQATTKLQMLSTKLAGIGCSWLGIQTEVRGTQIFSVTDKWTPLEIDEGCGGIRSLMALILISSVWAYLSKMALWKKILLFLSAFPLAIIGNMLRLTSIFVIAEHGDPEFARNTWHDWSGLIIFYPISLILLLGVHSLLEGGLPKLRKLKKSRPAGVELQTEQPTQNP